MLLQSLAVLIAGAALINAQPIESPDSTDYEVSYNCGGRWGYVDSEDADLVSIHINEPVFRAPKTCHYLGQTECNYYSGYGVSGGIRFGLCNDNDHSVSLQKDMVEGRLDKLFNQCEDHHAYGRGTCSGQMFFADGTNVIIEECNNYTP